MPPLGERLPLGDNAARVVKTGDAGAPPAASPCIAPPATSPCVFPPLHRPPCDSPLFPICPICPICPITPLNLYKVLSCCYAGLTLWQPKAYRFRTTFESPSNHLRSTSEQTSNKLPAFSPSFGCRVALTCAACLFFFRCKITALLPRDTGKTQQKRGGRVTSPYLPPYNGYFRVLIGVLQAYRCTFLMSANASR